MLKLTYLGRG